MSTPCPHCGATARATRNPFYGTGLAVHDTIINCSDCHRIRLANVREIRQEPLLAPTTKPRFPKGARPKKPKPATR